MRAAAVLLWLASCKEPVAAVAAAEPTWPAASAADAYFPLVAGRMYHYVTDENGEQGMMVANVTRTDATHGGLQIGNAGKRFVYDAQGVSYEGGAYVLKVPLATGTHWSGEHGGETRIVSADASVTVPAGTYGSCVETQEDVVPEAHYKNTYCPGVGLVRLEVESRRGRARVELQRYGAPMKI